MVKLIPIIAKGLIRDQYTRRITMFVVAIATMLMVFAGAVFWGSFEANPWGFMAYWAVCAWLALLLLLLALYDLVALRTKLAAEKRELKTKIFGSPSGDDHD
jgi:fatty acid desaturase